MTKHRISTISVALVYHDYVTMAVEKGRTKTDVDETIRWLTGYSLEGLEEQLVKQTDLETFLAEAPQLLVLRTFIKAAIGGVRVKVIEDPSIQEIRYLDKLLDKLANVKDVNVHM